MKCFIFFIDTFNIPLNKGKVQIADKNMGYIFELLLSSLIYNLIYYFQDISAPVNLASSNVSKAKHSISLLARGWECKSSD